ncbi:MAG: EscR/YscR/HrcR family type III secretion system export apparatus protein [Deltaproteobacteria bacterium]|nr:EscR/YscR/HrcR family type III secretion system export apparatus protein [Deltaproteobacteria bacterium]
MSFDFGSPTSTVLLLGALALVPFALMVLTSYAKIYIVLSFARTAVAAPQVPPNLVLAALATLLTVFTMAPTAREAYRAVASVVEQPAAGETTAEEDLERLGRIASGVERPLRGFLERNVNPEARRLFEGIAARKGMDVRGEGPSRLLALAPAFVVSELEEAFLAAFLLFLPFLVIDLVVSNILLALGMHMLSPTTVSLPFKLLLFVAVDGWELLSRGLTLGYR